MRQWLFRLGGIVCVLVVLAVALLGAHAAGLVCFSRGSGGPATVSQGPVTIGTDHSIYASSDTITVTITNRLGEPIRLVSQLGHCPVIVLAKVNIGRGQIMNPCYNTEAAPTITAFDIPADGSSGDTFNSSNLTIPLTDGTYAVSVRYIAPAPTFPPTLVQENAAASAKALGIVSPTFRVCTCRIC